MNSTIAQLLSLVAYGNEYTRKGKLDIDYNKSPIFQFCNEVSFTTTKENLLSKKTKISAGNAPVEWFAYLKETGCNELKVFYQHSKNQDKFKDHMTSAFVGGGGEWFIEAIYKKRSDFWYAHWEVNRPDDPERHIWKVVYEAVVRKKPVINTQLSLEETKQELSTCLDAIEKFATENKEENWAVHFRKAIEVLNSDTPAADFYDPSFIPVKSFQLTALQLIFASSHSWVFGGMGSWNDLGFAEHETYEHYEMLTAGLYEACIKALVAGINSY